ncbi:hypothetical protein AUJ84_04095 [Candidatus Pacearchaeota archaeon CG1_02_32_132]|nr:MAG: hypothetical protein AUJ84_04095 [Candidatus Pacearchaeota archaeon CG1_02_32_132]
MQKRGLSEVITTVLIILIVLISISIIWLFIRPAIDSVVGNNDDNPGEISKLRSCLDLELNVKNCNFLGNDSYQIRIERGNDELEIKEIVFKFKTNNNEFILRNNTLIPMQFGSAIYTFNLSKETQESINSVDISGILSNNNPCSFSGLSFSCSQQTIENNGENNFELLTTYALSWEGTPGLNSNVIPMYQLRIQNTPAQALAFTSQQPSRYRTIIDRSRYQGINTNESDKCQDPVSGNFYDCIWWDNGINATKQKYETFLSQYSQQGGELDYWILDTETWLSNWAIGSNKNDLSQQARWRAIQNDPRNVTLFQELNSRGFNGQDLLGTVFDWQNGGDNYLIWNSLMRNKVATYYNDSVYKEVKKYYPNVKMSNYGLNHWSQEYEVPELNGHKQYKYGSGSHVGTYQTQDGLYGNLGQVTWTNRLIQGYTYEGTPFNAFRYELNRMRSMKLSSTIEIQPWIIYKGWNKSLMFGTDYYEELMLHLTLINPETFLYWNYRGQGESPPSNDGNDTLFSNILSEADSLVGYKDKQIITYNYESYSDEEWWKSDYVLSGMEAKGQKVWRFTPNSTNYEINTNNIRTTFTTQRYNITIPQGEIRPNSVSTIGIWVTQPLGAGEITIQSI